jgi:four helix bundle protein
MRLNFLSKLTDCDGASSETDSALDFARDCKYITAECHVELTAVSQQIGRMLGSMIKNPGSFLIR